MMLTLAQRQEVWQMKRILVTLKVTLTALEMLLSFGTAARGGHLAGLQEAKLVM
jgi:hypothetical protein